MCICRGWVWVWFDLVSYGLLLPFNLHWKVFNKVQPNSSSSSKKSHHHIIKWCHTREFFSFSHIYDGAITCTPSIAPVTSERVRVTFSSFYFVVNFNVWTNWNFHAIAGQKITLNMSVNCVRWVLEWLKMHTIKSKCMCVCIANQNDTICDLCVFIWMHIIWINIRYSSESESER